MTSSIEPSCLVRELGTTIQNRLGCVVEGLCMMLLVVAIQIKFKLVFLLEADPAKLDATTY
jgi:hypothetical protein